MENASNEKRVTNGYSLRFKEDFRKRLEAVAAKKSQVTGKNVPLSSVLIEAVEYGLPAVEREILHQNALPFNVMTRTEKAIALCKSITTAAHESGIAIPGEAA